MGRVVLGGYTSLGIGGEAEAVIVRSREQIPEALTTCGVILGRGTNVLISDDGVTDRVAINRISTVVFDGTHVYAGSGALLASLAAMCCERGLSGLEWACGIPGSVGGAAYYIDRAGLKGEREGGASVSQLHAGFIINDGTATARDYLRLTERIEEEVRNKFGITLDREIRIIGEI